MDSPIKVHPRRGEVSSTEDDLPRSAGPRQTLAELGLRALSGTDFSSLMDEAVGLIAENLSVEYCAILELLDDSHGLLLRSGVGWDGEAMGRAIVDTNVDLMRGYTVISRGPVIVGNVREERRFDVLRLLRDDCGAVSGLCATIHVGNRVFGLLGAYTLGQRWFTEEEARFLEAVAKMLGAANERELIEARARLRVEKETERAEAAERRFRLLSEANELLSASLGCAATLASVARLAVPALANLCFVDMVEGDTIDRLLVMRPDHAGEEPAYELRHRYPLDSTANHGTPKVLRTGRPEIIPEVDDRVLAEIARDDHHLRMLHRQEPKSYMCVPLQLHRQLIGATGFVSAEPGRHYDADDLALAESLTRCAALAIDRALHRLPGTETARELIESTKRNEEAAPAAAGLGMSPKLTARQLEVLRLLSEGRPAKKISEELRLSETTVRNHIRALLHAVGARSQLEAVARARQVGLLAD